MKNKAKVSWEHPHQELWNKPTQWYVSTITWNSIHDQPLYRVWIRLAIKWVWNNGSDISSWDSFRCSWWGPSQSTFSFSLLFFTIITLPFQHMSKIWWNWLYWIAKRDVLLKLTDCRVVGIVFHFGRCLVPKERKIHLWPLLCSSISPILHFSALCFGNCFVFHHSSGLDPSNAVWYHG